MVVICRHNIIAIVGFLGSYIEYGFTVVRVALGVHWVFFWDQGGAIVLIILQHMCGAVVCCVMCLCVSPKYVYVEYPVEAKECVCVRLFRPLLIAKRKSVRDL